MLGNCILQDYSVIGLPEYNNQPIEVMPRVIEGVVFGHPAFVDGSRIRTEIIRQWVDEETVVTNLMVYKLGAKSENYRLFMEEYNSRI